MLRYRSNDGGQRRNISDLMLLCKLRTQTVEVDISLGTRTVFGRLMVFDKCACDLGATSQETFILWWEIRILLSDGRGNRRSSCGHLVICVWREAGSNFKVQVSTMRSQSFLHLHSRIIDGGANQFPMCRRLPAGNAP